MTDQAKKAVVRLNWVDPDINPLVEAYQLNRFCFVNTRCCVQEYTWKKWPGICPKLTDSRIHGSFKWAWWLWREDSPCKKEYRLWIFSHNAEFQPSWYTNGGTETHHLRFIRSGTTIIPQAQKTLSENEQCSLNGRWIIGYTWQIQVGLTGRLVNTWLEHVFEYAKITSGRWWHGLEAAVASIDRTPADRTFARRFLGLQLRKNGTRQSSFVLPGGRPIHTSCPSWAEKCPRGNVNCFPAVCHRVLQRMDLSRSGPAN